MTAASLRQLFLDFFKSHGHTVVKSGPLVPAGDPTLMFTNAGMVQFKDVFVGAETRPYKRAVTVQKCMRVSGKHNDLEEVGRTARHHTFFEMLGNFSFGDYFKEQAIVLAWDFITKSIQLPKAKLWITVFGGADGLPADDEARILWRKISGLPDSRILGKGTKDNFWAMGDTGPCGPCTEIHVDQGQGEPTAADFDNGRVMEIWNNVFMQFNRQPDGQLMPLPAPSVDTGMGLERVVALAQQVDSNYHSDLFMPLLATISDAVGKPYGKSPGEDDVSMRVIADHARATAFLVADGVQPSNEGRGYVMRRIMRRAIRHGKRLGFNELFLHRICSTVVRTMGDAYPELREAESLIGKVCQVEEDGFRRTLDTGLRILADEVASVRQRGGKSLPGEVVFKLYDTYGFPKDLTEVILQEERLSLDEAGFNAAMEEQKKRSRGGDVGHAAVAAVYKQLAARLGPTEFIGYTHEDEPLSQRPGRWRLIEQTFLCTEVPIKALLRDGEAVDAVAPGDAEVVLAPTPFYGESGGQAGDTGALFDSQGTRLASVRDTQKPVEDLVVCRVHCDAPLRVGQTVWAGYSAAVRKQTRAHHSATHLLHGGLRKVLGEHVKQAGSFVGPEHLRFDYAHFAAPTAQQLRAVETDVNRRIINNHPITTESLNFEAAKQKGALALFGEKYGDVVRVITMGESVEFCGGTHAKQTGDLDMLIITREEAVQSGVRRIEAEVGEAARRGAQRLAQRLGAAVQLLQNATHANHDETDAVLQAVAKVVRTVREQHAALGEQGQEGELPDSSAVQAPQLKDGFGAEQALAVRDIWHGLTQLTQARSADAPAIVARFGTHDRGGVLNGFASWLQARQHNERALDALRRGQRQDLATDLLQHVRTVGDVPLLTARVDTADAAALRALSDDLRARLPGAIVCLAGVSDGKVTLLIAVSRDLSARYAAGALVKELAPCIGGRGGGKPELAQAGGNHVEGIDELFARLEGVLARS